MKKLTVIIGIFILLLAVGCSKDTGQQIKTGSKFVGGNDGLRLSFAEGALPTQVFDQGQPFGISVIVTNVGDHTVENGADATVSITGIDPADFGVTASDLRMDSPSMIRGAQKDIEGNVIQGETVSFDFPAGGGVMQHAESISGSVNYNIRANLCYSYGTVSNTKLCVLEDILGTKGGQSKLCNINEDKQVDNSGGPVHVTLFRESVSSADKVAFVVKIQHVGAGKVHELGSECSEDFQKKDKVHVRIDTGISDGLMCSGLSDGAASGSVYEGNAQLLNGAREVRCTQTINNPTDLEKLVRIDLTYDYSQYIEHKIEVVHAGG